jgi:ubiquinone/menaquinone biosynthesis C-methylase UbiE
VTYKDYFSGHSKAYALARPDYPQSLFSYLNSLCHQHQLAWDCACGNGQATVALTQYFDKVIATDASEDQLTHAPQHKKIQYRKAQAEDCFLAPTTVDLVTVAQALHWFKLPEFYSNVRLALKTRGVLAVWCYGLHRIDDNVDKVVDQLYNGVLGPYWPEERRFVEAAYKDLDFPFEELISPKLVMNKMWSFEEMMNYLESWSAVQRYIEDQGKNPLDEVRDRLRSAWGGEPRREI